MTLKLTVKFTANFERDVEGLNEFLKQIDGPQAFDILLAELLDKVVPNLERFHDMGSSLLGMRAGSIECLNAQEALREKAGDTQVRQYVLPNYLILYAVIDEHVYLLSINHHRQLSFDLDSLWLSDFRGHNSRRTSE